MCCIWYPVELQHGDTPMTSLVNGFDEILESPVGASIAGRGNQQRMIQAGFKRETTSFAIIVLRRAAAPCKSDPSPFEDRERIGQHRVARIGETRCARNSVLRAPPIDNFELLFEIGDIFFGNTGVISRVVADFESVAMQ